MTDADPEDVGSRMSRSARRLQEELVRAGETGLYETPTPLGSRSSAKEKGWLSAALDAIAKALWWRSGGPGGGTAAGSRATGLND